MKYFYYPIGLILLLSVSGSAFAHHVLGRPSYSLSEDSNTPPAMQVETQIGEYFVTFMAFPAFPQPNQTGRVNLYASRIDNGTTFDGEVTFKVRDDKWFGAGSEEVLGKQQIDDGVYRQGFEFKQAGNYIITAEFSAADEPYIIDFPLRIGSPFPVGPIGLSVGVILLLLVSVNLWQRQKLQRLKAVRHRDDERE